MRKSINRRSFVKAIGSCAAGPLVLGVPLAGQDPPPAKVETNIADFLRVPKTRFSLPGPFPGKVALVTDKEAISGDRFDGQVVARMFEQGLTKLTGKNLRESFKMFFDKQDIVGLKVNPVGAPLINTRPELAEAVIHWLMENGLPRSNIVIWDRFDYMLPSAGFTGDRFPGITIEGLQTMDLQSNRWRDDEGKHVSIGNFDEEAYYLAKGVFGSNVQGYKDDEFYLNQHVFNGEYSYFGKLITQRLTKIINLAAYKNTGNGISMATKNLGYGALCNTGRLHAPLFFNVCTEVLAAPAIRDKLVLNITDGLRGQYDGGPDKNAQFVYPNCTLYFATDPFALDMVCHREIVQKRKEMEVKVNEHPRFTDYLRYAEELKLGIADIDKIEILKTGA
jgi:hypothetical protein